MIRKKKVMYEEDLHEIFFKFPYLIINDPNSIINTIHEYKLDSNSIPDIYIETDNKEFYCEVKLGKLKEKDLYQAIRYLNTVVDNIELNENKEICVILIGMNITKKLKNKAEKQNIKVKIIGKEIPGTIKICKKCRKAYNSKHVKCLFCDSKDILEIVNLKYP